MICDIDKSCFFCEYYSSFREITLKKSDGEEVILMGMHCKYFNKYSLPRFNSLKNNPFNTNIVTGADAEKVIKYYNELDCGCE